MTTTGPRADDVPPKATLYCPACPHRSRFDGDWAVTETARGERYACPDCGTVIAERPRPGRAAEPGAVWARTWRAWLAGVEAWQTLWYDAVGHS